MAAFRFWPSLLAVAVAAFLAGSAAALTFEEAAARLNGAWQGEGTLLWVDSQRAQANYDAERPFHWQRFLVKAVEGRNVTFTIGAELFEARIEDDTLTITSTAFRGKRRLERRDETAAR